MVLIDCLVDHTLPGRNNHKTLTEITCRFQMVPLDSGHLSHLTNIVVCRFCNWCGPFSVSNFVVFLSSVLFISASSTGRFSSKQNGRFCSILDIFCSTFITKERQATKCLQSAESNFSRWELSAVQLLCSFVYFYTQFHLEEVSDLCFIFRAT